VGFTPGNQFQVNKFKTIAEGRETGKILGNFKITRQAEGAEPVKVRGQEVVRGPIAWLKIGDGKAAVFAPGEVGATPDSYGRMLVVDRFRWTAGVQDKHYKEFWLEGNVLKGRWIFQFVPVTRIKGARRAWMISRPDKQRMDSEIARKLIDQD